MDVSVFIVSFRISSSLCGPREEEENLPLRESNPSRPARRFSLYRLTYPVSYMHVTVACENLCCVARLFLKNFYSVINQCYMRDEFIYLYLKRIYSLDLCIRDM
jgi:hypothetical protein